MSQPTHTYGQQQMVMSQPVPNDQQFPAQHCSPGPLPDDIKLSTLQGKYLFWIFPVPYYVSNFALDTKASLDNQIDWVEHSNTMVRNLLGCSRINSGISGTLQQNGETTAATNCKCRWHFWIFCNSFVLFLFCMHIHSVDLSASNAYTPSTSLTDSAGEMTSYQCTFR